MKSQAAVQFRPNEETVLTEVDLEEPRPDEVLVKVIACGICHTDISIRDNSSYYPTVLGHEGSGIIEKVGTNVKNVKIGDHVVLAYTYCGECEACKEGKTYECDHFSQFFHGFRTDNTSPLATTNGTSISALMRQGAFASYAVCHKHSITKIDEELDLRMVGTLGCGLMTGAGTVLNYLKPDKGKAFVVFGVGSVGLASVMAAKISGCDPIIAVDRLEFKLDMARQVGATHCINGDASSDLEETILDSCDGVDYGFDTTGSQKLLTVLQAVLNNGATACGVGGGLIVLTQKERNEGKSWGHVDAGGAIPQVFIPQLIDYYREGKFPFDMLIRFFSFKEINEAMDASQKGMVIKPVLMMD
ncbi:NAD(P)-dependent alcohol dehydrogenase [Aquibacillus halophilus]|nr:NAD(P)-dependent alcohol dehydrogenase [Aquibacillus halophilus]